MVVRNLQVAILMLVVVLGVAIVTVAVSALTTQAALSQSTDAERARDVAARKSLRDLFAGPPQKSQL